VRVAPRRGRGEEFRCGPGLKDRGGEQRVALGERDGNTEARSMSEVVVPSRGSRAANSEGVFRAGAFFGATEWSGKYFVEARDDGLFGAAGRLA